MPTFEYSALNATGQRVGGFLSGSSEQAVLVELESRQLTPIAIEERAEARRARRSISPRKLGTAYGQIADLLHAGVPLLRALKVLANRKSTPQVSEVFQSLADAVSGGEDLAAAMQARPETFPPVHIAMVRAGEKAGFLETVMARLGQLVLSQAEMRSKIIGNLIYPGLLVGFGTVILGVIFGFFVPMFRPMFDSIPGGAPWITRTVFALSTAIGRYGPITLAALVAAFFGVLRLARRPAVRRKLVEWRTFAPMIGPLERALAASRFCRMLGTMLANGVPMLGAMQIAREAAGNEIMEEAIAKAAEAVKSGQPLAGPLSESGLFEDDVIEMISVGESANNLDSVLVKIADTIEQRIDRLLTTLVRLIEPVLLLVLAAAVFTVAVALILPMTQLKPDF